MIFPLPIFLEFKKHHQCSTTQPNTPCLKQFLPHPTLRLPLHFRKKSTHLLHPTRIHLLQRLDPPPLRLLPLLLLRLPAPLLLALRNHLLVILHRALAADIIGDAAQGGGFGFQGSEAREVGGEGGEGWGEEGEGGGAEGRREVGFAEVGEGCLEVQERGDAGGCGEG